MLAGNTGSAVYLLVPPKVETRKVTVLCVWGMLLVKQARANLHVETVSFSRLIADMSVGDALRETVVS